MMAGILGRMKAASRGQPCRSPSQGQLRHLKAGSYPLLFPSVISGLAPPLLPRMPSHPPSSAGSTPSPASEYPQSALSPSLLHVAMKHLWLFPVVGW
ncbi:hypothetical protein ANANG_G00010200 [Anguilla anguilla]|uniref:Uncharacterized protein n=1 Tax=Anguilla anguilla TaxID=7936 RepID=A0A9D3MWN1_ANGAN|nr:hypothetical protein ANANG_G00010200 [Anguilla anguilla]